MDYFDLNVPYLEKDALAAGDTANAAKKASRLKKVVKAMELGYTGVAYDRLFKGIMSDKDRSAIAPFPVSSLLKAAPTLAESVKFHRQLTGVPSSATFRQYRRLTVVLDSVVGASVLNSGNPVLKSYDLVAARPTNQAAFEQACKVAEVDFISIDFSQKLSFRLKFPLVKAAIERGIYFEITYSQLLSSAELRREMLPNAKMLVSWTRGKNLIISSAAPTANEIRGPFDVVNLFSLLGLSTERAKAAISRNCRSLLASALRKKQCHKEAIRVESISAELKASGDLLRSWSNWDPISSGDGDLPSLDDFAKLFTNVTNESQKVARHHFSTDSVIRENKTFERKNSNDENISSQNIQTSSSCDAVDLTADSPLKESQNPDSSGFCLASEALPFASRPSSYGKDDLLPIGKLSAPPSSAVEPDAVGMGQDELLASRTCTMVCEGDLQPKYYMSSEVNIHGNPVIGSDFPGKDESEPSLHTNEPKISDESNFLPGLAETSVDGGLSSLHTCGNEDKDKCLLVQSGSLEVLNGSAVDVDLSCVRTEDAMFSTEHDMDFKASDVPDDQGVTLPEVLNQEDFTSRTSGVSVQDCHAEASLNEQQDDATPITNLMSVKENNEAKENLFLVTTDMKMEGMLNVEGQKQGCGASESLADDKHKSGKCRFIQKRKKRLSLFPHKSFLKPFLFKKKDQRLKGSRKHERC